MSSDRTTAAEMNAPDGRRTHDDAALPVSDEADDRRRTQSDAAGSSGHSGRQRRPRGAGRQRSLRERLWPACLGGAKAARRRSMRAVADDGDDDDEDAENEERRQTEEKELLTDDDRNRKQQHQTVTSSSMDAGPITIVLSGGGPYGFRLSEDGSGHLYVSKVNSNTIQFTVFSYTL